MIRVHIFCEGQTEETFVNNLLFLHFQNAGIAINPILFTTSKIGKGGISTYGKIKRQVDIKCKEDPSSYVTTLIDFYALPSDFPGKNEVPPLADSMQKVIFLESKFDSDISHKNFIPNIVLHEFEGLLFSDPTAFNRWFGEDVTAGISKIRSGFKTPEDINDSSATAPSKRILSICKNYNKISHGSSIAEKIGLERIRSECAHFNAWLNKMENIGGHTR
ncbi:MAG: hypothetical protein BWY69_00334 [Planctomycetes bacterium ADurb.Bin401]|nr:MAG: hypothetical protein BWY69_00334 [Planctomycetes bacterium ADurb.Bin401]